ncbi:MAG: two-component system, LytTR family, sensor kinase [Acidobacteriota bacterium]|jgi:hypothetical protein|nr:two-component system, LytTR family, sensor kinase [Acidobacteriota bacterium]
MPTTNVAAVIHLLGFVAGAALYGMLFALVLQRRMPLRKQVDDTGDDRLPLATAVLGLIWNVAGLAGYGIRDFAARDPHPLLIGIAYSALGFLPAVVVHSVLRSQRDGRFARVSSAIIRIAYAASSVAAVMMLWSAAHGVAPSTSALQTLTWSYVALTLPLLLLTRRRPGGGRAWSIIALAVFAVTALHLSRETPHDAWYVELAGHHASIPLIFAILYHDFRFALADLFLKRAVALFVLVSLASGLYVAVEVPLLARHDFRNDPVAIAGSVILLVVTALSYSGIRRASTWFVDTVMLHRVNYAALRDDIAARISALEEPADVLDVVTELLRAPLAANELTWSEQTSDAGEAEAVVEVPTTEEPRYALRIAGLAGGRRLLSDDVTMINDVSLLAGRRIDALRLARERYDRGLHEQEMSKLATEAELRALRAQVNPHFLFNALNTIGYLIQTSPPQAEITLMKLTSLLRGVLRTGGAAVTLGEEIELVTAYLEIEQARFEERLNVQIDLPPALRAMRIPPLLIQPLVENAIKHGIARSRTGGDVVIEARADGANVVVTVRNTGCLTTEKEIADGRRHGVGLSNLDARLRHHYDTMAGLTLTPTSSDTFAVIVLPAAGLTARSAAGGA